MARRPAEGSLTGGLVFCPELALPPWDPSHLAIGRAALPLFAVLLLGWIEPPPADGQEVLTNDPVISSTAGGAHYRITDRQPVFCSSHSAGELRLVRLKPRGDITAWKQERPCK